MKKYIKTLAILAVFMLPSIASAQPSCGSLGFTKRAPDCAGSQDILKCPTDLSAVFCVGSVDQCPSISVGNYEKCTKYCESDKNVCIEKREMTCDEYISKMNGRKIADGDSIGGTQTRNLYLMGKAQGSSGWGYQNKFVQISINDASEIPACKAEGAKEAEFETNNITLEGGITFNVKSKINYVYFNPQGSSNNWSATFTKDSDIKVSFYANKTWATSLNLNFYSNSYDQNKKTKNKVNIHCEGSDMGSGNGWQWDKPECNVNIMTHQAEVAYCKQEDNSIAKIECQGEYGGVSCKEDYNACYF